jgi:site-specific recombinase XerD
MKEIIKAYLQVVKDTRKPKTYNTYRQALQTFVALVGDAKLDTETYIAFLRKTKELSPSTQAIYRSAVMGLYIFYASTHPEINLAALRQANRRYASRQGVRLPNFNRDAIERIIAHCAIGGENLLDLRDRAFILTLADTGLRISEACSLRRGDVDWKEGRVMLIGKGDKQAVVRFSNRCMLALREYLHARSKLDGESRKPLASLPLFARHDKGAGKKIKPVLSGGMWHAIKEFARKANVPPESIRIHDFRHYFVTVVYLASDDLKLAQELARHSDIRTTGRYAHLGSTIDEKYNEIFNRRENDKT